MKTKTRFPSLRSLTCALVSEQKTLRRLCSKEDLTDEWAETVGTDLRLQVCGSNWFVHTGSADYDQNHRGHWGASFLPYGRANLREIALELIEQAKDSQAEGESADKWESEQAENRALIGAGLHPSQTGCRK